MKSKLLFAIGCLLFSGTMFFSDSRLVDGVVLLKWYVFGFGALLLGCVWIWSKRGCIRVDPVFGTILLFVGYLLLRILIAQGVGLGSLILIAFLLVYVICIDL